MEKQIKKLSKAKLIELSLSLLDWHERHYNAVDKKEEDPEQAFWQLAGNFKAIRDFHNLPKLYE